MEDNQSDVLSLHDSDSGDFSGFESDDIPKLRSAVVCTKGADKGVKNIKKVNKKKGNVKKTGVTPSSSSAPVSKKSKSATLSSNNDKSDKPIDFSSLSERDLTSLKKALGLENDIVRSEVRPEENVQSARPNLHISFDRDDLNGEVDLDYYDEYVPNPDFQQVLFEDTNEVEWQMPKLKAPEKGPAINQNLAQLINAACIQACDTDTIVSKYKIPVNCTFLGAPRVNEEIWKILDRRAKSQDRSLAEIQHLLSASMVPIVQLADILKPSIQANPQARSIMSDVMTVIGQVQYQLSVRRRYLLRPSINKKYSNLCNVNTPISSHFFGDDIGKEIKNCDAGVTLAKEIPRARGRGYTRPYQYNRYSQRGGYSGGDGRFSPYPQRGQQNYRRGFSYRGRRNPPSATVTSEQAKN